jgi:hypothetical protein
MNVQTNNHDFFPPGSVAIQTLSPSLTLRKSNRLVNSRNSLTATQQRILLLMLASSRGNEKFDWLEIPIHKAIDITGQKMAQGGQYRQIRESVAALQQKPVYVPYESGEWKALQMIEVDSEKAKGAIRVRFTDSEDIREVVSNTFQKGGAGYTSYKLGIACKLRKKYSLRIYEKLKRTCNQQQRERTATSYSLKMLRYEFCLEDKYSNNGDFKRWVLDPAVEEINSVSDLTVSYQLDRKYNASVVRFSVAYKKSRADQPKQIGSKAVAVEGDALALLYLKYGQEYVDFCRNQVQKKSNVQNQTAYLKKALQDGYFSEEYQLRKARENKQQEETSRRNTKLQFEELYKASYNEQINSVLKQLTEDHRQKYIADRLASEIPQWRKYAGEIQQGKPSRFAQVNLAVWYIEHFGSSRQKELLSIEDFARSSGVDWKQLEES